MSASVLYISMSLDGVHRGPQRRTGQPRRRRFSRLHDWFVTPEGEFIRPSGPAGELIDEINATGAILVGRRTADRPITGAVIITVGASRSSCPVTDRPAHPSRAIRW
jgi:hypothetical protein